MNNEIESSLYKTIRDSELSELGFDVADALTSSIPIFGSLSKLLKGVNSIHTYFYCKKVLSLLREVESIPKEKRQAQLNKMLSKPGESEKFGEHIALLLDRMNDVDKAKMMGKVSRAFIEEKITLDDLKSLNFALDTIDLRMADYLKEACKSYYPSNNPQDQLLAQCGLMSPELNIETTPLEIKAANLDGGFSNSERYETFKSAKIQYKITHLGKIFVEICLS